MTGLSCCTLQKNILSLVTLASCSTKLKSLLYSYNLPLTSRLKLGALTLELILPWLKYGAIQMSCCTGTGFSNKLHCLNFLLLTQRLTSIRHKTFHAVVPNLPLAPSFPLPLVTRIQHSLHIHGKCMYCTIPFCYGLWM